MRKVPIQGNNNPFYQSMTAHDLIVLLSQLKPDTVVMSGGGNVIHHIVADKTTPEIVYLSHKLLLYVDESVVLPSQEAKASSQIEPNNPLPQANGTHQSRILKFLDKDRAKSFAPKDIAKALGLKANTVGAVLSQLKKTKDVWYVGFGKWRALQHKTK